jgi:hypothetical protein
MSQHIFFSDRLTDICSLKPENNQDDLAAAKIPNDFIRNVTHGVVFIVRNSKIGPFAPPRKQSRSDGGEDRGAQRPITSCRRVGVGVTGPIPEVIKEFHAWGGGGDGLL